MTDKQVDVTRTDWLRALVPLVADLPQEMAEAERYRRLLAALLTLFPCDAVALLRLEGDALVPLATEGLSGDVLGRRFRLADHPRLATLLGSTTPHRFPPDSPLPDPYDGLLDRPDAVLEVHDCMGCGLEVEGRPWGVLTLDALQAGRFDAQHLEMLGAFGTMAAATVAAAMRINRLAQLAQTEHTRAESYRRAAGQPERRLLGQSAAFRRLLRDIALVGPSQLTVLITGETGVGKELVAQAIHARSERADRPLVSLNCAALPDTLVESELFGHVRGAFTGAVAERQGKFELADGGTLFLDEVAEMPLPVQAKLLRVLQGGQLQRLGSDREHRVDVRLIAATNRDLAEEVRAGRLRADFYHRLSAFPLRVPPLRERGRDVLVLAGYFLEDNRSRLGLGALRLDASAQAALLGYAWPGNVRELEHLIGRSVLRSLARQTPRPRIVTLTADDLALPVDAPAEATLEAPIPLIEPGRAAHLPAGLRASVEAYERQLVEQTLDRNGGNWAAAARALQVDRANLSRLARRLGIAIRQNSGDTRASRDRSAGKAPSDGRR